MTLPLINQILFFGTLLGLILFLIFYSLRSAWWTTIMGRNMLAFMTVIMVLMSLAALRRLFGPVWFEAHRDGLSFWSYGALFVVVWWRFLILIRIQRDERQTRQADRRSLRRDDDTDPDLNSSIRL